ncbi:hypothetical protein J3R83DRAFT_8623 [Lanmaoa asiatica]|nr:hypothetical protein J3R83DRAFT_8623 [Lanmaoa asiatica]
MSSKRKWDQAAPDVYAESELPSKATKTDEVKSASEAAAAAAAIAAKIAAQFSAGGSAAGSIQIGQRDPHDAEFTHDIDINDVRNRYVLTKGSTQAEIHEETGASVSTKGVWYPDRSKATEKDPPLYLHLSASTRDVLQKAIDRVNDLVSMDLGPLVEDKKDRLREKRKWPEEKLPVGLETIRNFNVRAKVVGPQGVFVKYIQQETGTRVQIKGLGSGFVEQETGKESEEPMHIHITYVYPLNLVDRPTRLRSSSGPDEGQVARAKVLTEDLLEVVHAEHGKAQAGSRTTTNGTPPSANAICTIQCHVGGYGSAPPPPDNMPPPPPPGEQPPPPPDGSAPPPAPGDTSMDAYAAYCLFILSHAAFSNSRAQFGYDVNSSQFKEWAASQQQQYNQYYAQGYGAGGATGAAGGPPVPSDAAPPPPPPPPA